MQRVDGMLSEALLDGSNVLVDELAGEEEETVRRDILREPGELFPGADPGLVLGPQVVLDRLFSQSSQDGLDGADPNRDMDTSLGSWKVIVRPLATDPGNHLLFHGRVQDRLENVQLFGLQQAEALGEAGMKEDYLNIAVPGARSRSGP